MEEEKDAFYVVRKGDVVGVYNTLKECQAQVWDPTFSVYKGYCMPKDAEEYLASHGLKNAMYSICSTDIRDDLFGPLVPCSQQQKNDPFSSFNKTLGKTISQKRSADVQDVYSINEASGSTSIPCKQSKYLKLMDSKIKPIGTDNEPSIVSMKNIQQGGKYLKFDDSRAIPVTSRNGIYLLEFDGASKGNPGKAGAGAVLRAEDGNVISRLREGVGIATNNFAEYRAVILGMKYALRKGFDRIKVQGDSMLVCMQIQNIWQTKNKNIMDLSIEAKKLKEKFRSFQINHIPRELNAEADRQANLAIELADGEIEEECGNVVQGR